MWVEIQIDLAGAPETASCLPAHNFLHLQLRKLLQKFHVRGPAASNWDGWPASKWDGWPAASKWGGWPTASK